MIAQRAWLLPLENGYCPDQSPAAGHACRHRARRQRGRRDGLRIVAPYVDLRLQRIRRDDPLVLAQHGIDPGGRGAALGEDLDDAREQAEPQLMAAELAWLQDAQYAGAVKVRDGFRRHVARGGGRRGAFGERGDQRACLLQQACSS